MSKRFTGDSDLRTCRLPLKAPVLLACSKCQKRLKHDGDPESLTPLKKLLKRISKEHGTRAPRILKVPCLKLCPGNALVVLTPQQLAEGRCSIVRTREDVDAVYAQLASVHGKGATRKLRPVLAEEVDV